MHEIGRTGRATHPARSAVDGARLPVTAGSSRRRTSLFAVERSDEHYPGRHAATRRPAARTPHRQDREQTLTASILYGRRKMQYGQHA